MVPEGFLLFLLHTRDVCTGCSHRNSGTEYSNLKGCMLLWLFRAPRRLFRELSSSIELPRGARVVA